MRKLVAVVLGAALLAPTGVGADGESPPGLACYRDPDTGELRQSWDPMSPPCVPYYEGDNGGETWRGVNEDEVHVVITVDVGSYAGEATPPAGTYIDLDAPSKPPCEADYLPDLEECDHVLVRSARALLLYFNTNWQTYNRRVHAFMYFTDASSRTARRNDASRNLADISPFAVIDQGIFSGYNDAYVSAAAGRGMMVFASPSALTEDVYSDGAPFVWTFWPDTSDRADIYASYVCQNVAPYPVSHSGGPSGAGGFNGEHRRFGLYYTTDPDAAGLLEFRHLVRQRLAACGVSWEAEASFPQEGFVVNNGDLGAAQLAAVAAFQGTGVTTVLWLGGVEGKFSHYAAAAGFFPEIVLAGDRGIEGRANGRLQNQLVWANAWGPTFDIRDDYLAGEHAVGEAMPNATEDERLFGSRMYRDLFMLFYAVQVTGPDLNPWNVEAALRAVPASSSSGPHDAACSFPEGEYTCVDDAMELWWDGSGRAPGTSSSGCMRAIEGGSRLLPWEWSGQDRVFANPNDPCIGNGRTNKMRPL